MKTLKLLLLSSALLPNAPTVNAQPAFRNLDFESARLIPIPGDPYGMYYFANAFPGWSGYRGTNQVTGILYDDVTLGAANQRGQSKGSVLEL